MVGWRRTRGLMACFCHLYTMHVRSKQGTGCNTLLFICTHPWHTIQQHAAMQSTACATLALRC